MIGLADVPLEEAIRMITLTPARILKIDKTKGSIEIGKEADLVLFDKDININTTIINGKVVYKKLTKIRRKK